ncbi:MAG: phytase [bacterium]
MFSAPTVSVQPTVETDPVPSGGDAADDICIWIHPNDVSQSTIIGTDKRGGGLAVYNLDGSQIQFISVVEPNNVDMRYNFSLSGVPTTLVCFSEQNKDVIGIYKVDLSTRLLSDVAAGPFKPGYSVYGFGMYISPATGKYYCYITSQSGAVQQWELSDNGAGKVDAVLVRTLSVGSQSEGVVADDILGNLYIAEEDVGVWKYGAEPNDGSARTFVDGIGGNGNLNDDIEGLTIYYRGDGTGYLIVSSQGADEFVVYTREGNNDFLAKFDIIAGNGIDRVSDTDGIDVSNFSLGPLFPQGVFVAQDGTNDTGNQNFKLVPWDAIANATTPPLVIDTSWDPRLVGRQPPTDPPDAPSNLGATATGTSTVDLTWLDNSNNEIGFKIERKTGSNPFSEIASAPASATNYTDNGLQANTNYTYRLKAYNIVGESAYSNQASAATDSINPNTNLALNKPALVSLQFPAYPASDAVDGSDATAWAASTGNPSQWLRVDLEAVQTVGRAIVKWHTIYFATQYQLQVSNDDANWTTVFSTTAGAGGDEEFTFTQTNAQYIRLLLAQNSDIYYGVKEFEIYSGSATTNPPNPPSNLSATAVSSSQIDLAWSDGSNDEDGFKIERKTGLGGTYAEIASVGTNTTGFSDNGLAANTTYFYRVRAFNSAGNSAYSNEASATTQNVNQPPAATITQPSNGQTFTVGQTVNYASDGTDPEDGILPAANFTWYVDLPGGQTITLAAGVKSGSGVPQVPGSYTLRLEVKDSGGLMDTDEVNFIVNAVSPGLSLAKDAIAPELAFVATEVIPAELKLFDAYPNPFNPSTVISYQLSAVSKVELDIYNLLGQKIRTLVKAEQNPGKYSVNWDGRDEMGQLVSSGIFIYILRVDQNELRKRMLLLK